MKIAAFIKKNLGFYPKVKLGKTSVVGKKYGNEYGGFVLCPALLHSQSIVYSIGIGEDVSFDKAVMDDFGCVVYAYDPTPRVKAWVEAQNLSSNFVFSPVGLSEQDGELRFYTPLNPHHISHSALRLSEHQKEIVVPCSKLSTLMSYNKHSHIDLLKMDIEGFEYAVLKNILQEKISITQIVVEFHHYFKGIGNGATENAVHALLGAGYLLFSISERYQEFSFVRKEV